MFVTSALSPAKVQRVSIVDEAERIMEVIVEDKQLSLAIGKKGQNVRLAAKLTGWKIDIKSEEDKRREVEAQFGELEAGTPEDGAAAAEGGGEPLEAAAAEGADTQAAAAGESDGSETVTDVSVAEADAETPAAAAEDAPSATTEDPSKT
jgi:N utilization substance protein A